MRGISSLTCILVLALVGATRAGDDLSAQLQTASKQLAPVMPQAEELLAAGEADKANQLILATFPEKERTPAQMLVLGNLLFKQDPKLSHALHEQAAKALPDNPTVQYEWALDQHRAGEYAGAADSYGRFLAKNPNFAPAHGLSADCLIRTGKVTEAIAAWKKSEQATKGTLEDFETVVCEVHGPPSPHRERSRLVPLVKKGDIDAVENLVVLDAKWEVDWWNFGPNEKYLERDLAMIQSSPIEKSPRLDAAICAAKCALSEAREADDVAAILKQAGFVLDDKKTLPASGKILRTMLRAALAREAVTTDELRISLGDKILAQAKATKDAETYDIAAGLLLKTDRADEIDRAGWADTKDVRFAASLLVGMHKKKSLKLDSPELVDALKQFPEDPYIARLALDCAVAANKPLEPYLIRCIAAEYSHLSAIPPGVDLPRPNARTLRALFKKLAEVHGGK